MGNEFTGQRAPGPGLGPLELLERGAGVFRRSFRADAWIYYLATAPVAVVSVSALHSVWSGRNSSLPIGNLALLWAGAYALRVWGCNHYQRRVLERMGGITRRPCRREICSRAALAIWHRALLLWLWLLTAWAGGGPYFYVCAQYMPLLAASEAGGESTRRPQPLRAALRLARGWPKEQWAMLLIVATMWVLILVNLALAALVLPGLAQALLGIHNSLARAGMGEILLSDPVFWFAMAMSTYLAFDPVVKCTLTVAFFAQRSAATGAWLRAELLRAQAATGATAPFVGAGPGLRSLRRAAPPRVPFALGPARGQAGVARGWGPRRICLGCARCAARALPEWRGLFAPTLSVVKVARLPRAAGARVAGAGLSALLLLLLVPHAQAVTVARHRMRGYVPAVTASEPAVAARAARAPQTAPLRAALGSRQMAAALRAELAQPEYAWRNGATGVAGHWLSPLQRFFSLLGRPLSRFFHWLGGVIERLLHWLSGGNLPAPAAAPLRRSPLAALAWIGAAALLALVVWMLAMRLRRPPDASGNAPAAVPAVPAIDAGGAEERDENEWFALAQSLTGQGELRLAFRAAFLGGLAGLAARRLLTLRRDRTNREYLEEFRRRVAPLGVGAGGGEPARRLRDCMCAFDEVWYGERGVDRALLDRFLAAEREMLTSV